MDGKVTPKNLKQGMRFYVVLDDEHGIRPANRKDAKRQVAAIVVETPEQAGTRWNITTNLGAFTTGASQWLTLVDTDVTTEEQPASGTTARDIVEYVHTVHTDEIEALRAKVAFLEAENAKLRSTETDQYTAIRVYMGDVHAIADGMDKPLCETPIRRYTTIGHVARLEFGHGTCTLCAERTQIL